MSRLGHHLEQYPLFGYLGSISGLCAGWFTWFVEHADDLGKMVGLIAAFLGLIAGYYTLRIQRRAWQHARSADRLRGKD